MKAKIEESNLYSKNREFNSKIDRKRRLNKIYIKFNGTQPKRIRIVGIKSLSLKLYKKRILRKSVKTELRARKLKSK